MATSRPLSSMMATSWWGRHEARFRDCSRPVSSCRPPEPDVRVGPASGSPQAPSVYSSSSACQWPGRRDRRSPGPVARGDYRTEVKQHDLSVPRPPCAVAVAAAQCLPARVRVFASHPPEYLTPNDHPQVSERAGGHPGAEVGGPAPQHRIELVQQDHQRQADVHPADRLALGLDRPQGLLGRVVVDVMPVGSPLLVTLDAPTEKVEALVDVGDQRLVHR